MSLDTYMQALATEERTNVEQRILELLAASGPCQFRDMLTEVHVQCNVPKEELVPTIILALAKLMLRGSIEEYEQIWTSEDKALDYAWDIADDVEV